jgi:outer membrane protein OmpA-like peptidoglycan-associated protein
MKPKFKEEGFGVFVSDIMSVLMVIFLFIAIAFIQEVKKKTDEAKDIVENYEQVKEEIIEAIKLEFLDEFSEWNALVDPLTLSFQFNSPDVLFKRGSSELTPKFKMVLNDFFPRYLDVIKKDNYINYISAIQIEGHTSSEWDGRNQGLPAYLNNMELSQSRSAKVLEYVLKIEGIGEADVWTRNKITSIGYSSSQLKYKEIGPKIIEDKISSRRVAFRIVTDGEKRLDQISGKKS